MKISGNHFLSMDWRVGVYSAFLQRAVLWEKELPSAEEHFFDYLIEEMAEKLMAHSFLVAWVLSFVCYLEQIVVFPPEEEDLPVEETPALSVEGLKAL